MESDRIPNSDPRADRVTRNDAAGRYELLVDGEMKGFADFQVEGSVVSLPHTVVDPASRGHGLAAELVAAALDDIRSRGQLVDPVCSYVERYMRNRPETLDLLAPG